MNDVMRDRIWRKLQVLPDEQLYEVLDFIEFVEHKYAPGRARRPDGIQRFAERLEDSMRMRSVAPKVISGTVGAIGTARRVFRSVTDAGREIIDDFTTPATGPSQAATQPPIGGRRIGGGTSEAGGNGAGGANPAGGGGDDDGEAGSDTGPDHEE